MATRVSLIYALDVDPSAVCIRTQPYRDRYGYDTATTAITTVNIGDDAEVNLHIVGHTAVEQLENAISLGYHIVEAAQTHLAKARATTGTVAHTVNDEVSLRKSGIDPLSVQPRERSVPCAECCDATWNLSSFCDLHYKAPGATRIIQSRTVTR